MLQFTMIYQNKIYIFNTAQTYILYLMHKFIFLRYKRFHVMTTFIQKIRMQHTFKNNMVFYLSLSLLHKSFMSLTML